MKVFFFTVLFLLAPTLTLAADPLLITEAEVSNISDTQAMVSWKTDRPGSSVVTYSQNPCPCTQGTGDADGSKTTVHEVTLTGLTADRTYSVQPISVDAGGIRSEGPILALKTLRDLSSLPTPELNDVRSDPAGADVIVVSWKTQVALRAGNGVEYGMSPCPCSQNIQFDLGSGTEHRVEVAPLFPNTTYYLRPFSFHPRDTTNTIRYGKQLTITTSGGATPNSTSTILALQYPNGGQKFKQGQRHLLSWKITPGFVQSLTLIAINEPTGTRTVLLDTYPVEQRPFGSTVFTLPATLPTGTYSLELSDATNPSERDRSDATVMIGDPPPPPPPEPTTPAPPPAAPASQAPLTFLPSPPPPIITTKPAPPAAAAVKKPPAKTPPKPAVKKKKPAPKKKMPAKKKTPVKK